MSVTDNFLMACADMSVSRLFRLRQTDLDGNVLSGHVRFFSNRTHKCRVRDMSGHVRECPQVMSRGHQCFCSEIGHVNVLVSCVQRTFLETMFNFNAIIMKIIMYEKLLYYQ
jgi:hypothetical protein